MPTTTLSIHFFTQEGDTNKSWYKVVANAKTRGIFSYLFRIENQYVTVLEKETFEPIRLSKDVNQKNIKQKWILNYNQTRHLATIDSLKTWEIPEKCHNYFSMLFYLRSQPLKPGDEYQFALDVEYLCWFVTATVDTIEMLKLDNGECSALKISLHYENAFPERDKRPWKTDLLTNRIAGKSRNMIVWFANAAERTLLRVVYDENTSMHIKMNK